VFEKGIWRACNAFVRAGGVWRGGNNITNIIAEGFALHFQTCATLMDPASPCQSSLVPSMRRVEGQNWFNRMYGLDECNRNLRIEVFQDWCNESDITTLAAKEQTENRRHYVPTDATKVRLTISYNNVKQVTTTGFVYSTVPEECEIKWSETSKQRLSEFENILLGNTENGDVFRSDKPLHLKLQCIIGKENGDCDQMYAILYNAIQLATHWCLNQPNEEDHHEHLGWDKCFTEIMKEIMVVTCDRVVYYTCMGLKISCTYTGSGDGTVHVYEPYKKDLDEDEKANREAGMLIRKAEADADNLIKFLSGQNKLLSTVIFSGSTSVRYESENGVRYEPFPNNCYGQLKEIVRYKKNRLDIVIVCVSNIKAAIDSDPIDNIDTIAGLVLQVALALIITNPMVISTEIAMKIFTVAFSAMLPPTAPTDFTQLLNTREVKEAVDCVILGKFTPLIPPNIEYVTSIAKNIGTDISEYMRNQSSLNSYPLFLSKLIDYILKDENNKCVSTTQEDSKYRDVGYLTVYILNNSSIPRTIFDGWKPRASETLNQRVTRRIRTSGQGGGGRIRKKIIQTGGNPRVQQIVNIIIEEVHETNLNVDRATEAMIQELQELQEIPEITQTEINIPDLLEQIIKTQTDQSILRYYLSNLSEYRLRRINGIEAEISSLESQISESASPAFRQTHQSLKPTSTPPQKDKDSRLGLLYLEHNEQIARRNKEQFINEMFKNDTPDEDKDYYWKTRNDLIPVITDPKSLSIIENTVLEISDIEMLVCVYMGIVNTIFGGNTNFGGVFTFLNQMYRTISSNGNEILPLTWLLSRDEHIGVMIINFTKARKQFYPPAPPNPTSIALTKLLLYGVTHDSNINIPDNSRILVLFMLHLLLNEVIMDMIPDSFGKNLIVNTDILSLLERSYTLSSSIDPSNHTQKQIEEAKRMPKVMSVSQQIQQVGVVAHASDSPAVVGQGWASGTIFDEVPNSIPSPSPAQGETHKGNLVTPLNLFQPQSRKDKFIEFLRDKEIPSAAIDLITPVTIDDSEFDNIDQLVSKIERIHNDDLMRASGSNIDKQLTNDNIEYIRGLLIQFMNSRFASSASSPPSPPSASSASSASPAPTTDPTRVCFGCPKATPTQPWVGRRLKALKALTAAAAEAAAAQKRERPPTEGGSTTSTRRKLHRNHRRTQYTNKHKRSIKNTKHNTIKHRKSYRKHNRTIKRRKSRRHH
jgi:hypothetical protein